MDYEHNSVTPTVSDPANNKGIAREILIFENPNETMITISTPLINTVMDEVIYWLKSRVSRRRAAAPNNEKLVSFSAPEQKFRREESGTRSPEEKEPLMEGERQLCCGTSSNNESGGGGGSSCRPGQDLTAARQQSEGLSSRKDSRVIRNIAFGSRKSAQLAKIPENSACVTVKTADENLSRVKENVSSRGQSNAFYVANCPIPVLYNDW